LVTHTGEGSTPQQPPNSSSVSTAATPPAPAAPAAPLGWPSPRPSIKLTKDNSRAV